MSRKLGSIAMIMVVILGVLVGGIVSAVADININVSPMRESVVLNPGDTYKSSFVVSNPGFSEQDLSYHVKVSPFYVNEKYDPIFENENDSGMIADWITITSGEKGVVAPNESAVVEYKIEVPKTAPAGGQYASISAVTDINATEAGAINIGEGMAINYIVLAEITGDTVVSGEILDMGVPSFLLGGMIRASSTVKNDGNVHGSATYTMKVYPLFSDTPIYTNEEHPEMHYVLPDRTFHNESYWEETPMMGIYNVSYIVEFQGLKSEVTSMVIVCPWWILFIVILGIVILVIRAISLIKLKKMAKAVEAKKRSVTSEEKNDEKTA